MLRMMPKAEKMLAEMVMKRESPLPKTNLRISVSLSLESWTETQLFFTKPMYSFCPDSHLITSTSSGSGVVVFWVFWVVGLAVGVVFVGLLDEVPGLEIRRAVTEFSVGPWSGLEFGPGRLWLFVGVQVVVGDLIHLGDANFN